MLLCLIILSQTRLNNTVDNKYSCSSHDLFQKTLTSNPLTILYIFFINFLGTSKMYITFKKYLMFITPTCKQKISSNSLVNVTYLQFSFYNKTRSFSYKSYNGASLSNSLVYPIFTVICPF